jgi:aminoglycoside phosphotransferase (APT) family kinase protein
MAILEIDDGFDFKVVVVDERWVVRVPRRAGVLEALGLETALLPRLASELPVEVPQFELVSADPPFVVYRLLAGTPLAGEDSAGVRAFLNALHGVRTDILPATDWIERYREQCARFVDLVFPLLDTGERLRSEELFAEVEWLRGFEPCVIHGDLGAEHMLVRDGRLAAVIDWGDAALGDPALDYAWLVHELYPEWELEPDLRRRATFYYRLAPFYSVHYGVFRGQPDYAANALVKLRDRLGLTPRP